MSLEDARTEPAMTAERSSIALFVWLIVYDALMVASKDPSDLVASKDPR